MKAEQNPDQPANTPDDQPIPEPKLSAPAAHRPAWFKHNLKWLIPVCLIVTAIVVGGVIYALRPAPTAPVATATPSPTPSPTPVPTPVLKASPLTGELIDPALADRAIRSIIVENHPDARPQSGLSDAGVVYEALAEGGITRFQTFFLDKQPKAIGPVRSLRPYFIDWGLEFNAPVAHAGGSSNALDLVKPLGLKDINALIVGPPTFYRTSDRYAPHNLYTSSSLMDALLTARGWNVPANFTVSPRKADAPAQTPSHPAIHINFSYNGYQVDYTYVAASNDYARNLAGAPHIDRNTGTQIHVKNVIVEYMPTTYGTSTSGAQATFMQTVGSGKALVFMDGGVIGGTWSKTSHNARTTLTDAAGAEIPLNVGNTWYSIVPIGNLVSY